MSCGDIFLGLIAILFPPIAVWIKSGICSCDSLINILLCMLGYLPGLLHAWYIIARNPERNWDYEAIPDAEAQRVTYYYIRTEPVPPRAPRNYGTQAQSRPAALPPPPPTAKSKKGSSPRNDDNNGNNGEASSRPAPPPPNQPVGPSVGAGNDEPGAPPSYSEVVRGDNKIQTQD